MKNFFNINYNDGPKTLGFDEYENFSNYLIANNNFPVTLEKTIALKLDFSKRQALQAVSNINCLPNINVLSLNKVYVDLKDLAPNIEAIEMVSTQLVSGNDTAIHSKLRCMRIISPTRNFKIEILENFPNLELLQLPAVLLSKFKAPLPNIKKIEVDSSIYVESIPEIKNLFPNLESFVINLNGNMENNSNIYRYMENIHAIFKNLPNTVQNICIFNNSNVSFCIDVSHLSNISISYRSVLAPFNPEVLFLPDEVNALILDYNGLIKNALPTKSKVKNFSVPYDACLDYNIITKNIEVDQFIWIIKNLASSVTNLNIPNVNKIIAKFMFNHSQAIERVFTIPDFAPEIKQKLSIVIDFKKSNQVDSIRIGSHLYNPFASSLIPIYFANVFAEGIERITFDDNHRYMNIINLDFLQNVSVKNLDFSNCKDMALYPEIPETVKNVYYPPVNEIKYNELIAASHSFGAQLYIIENEQKFLVKRSIFSIEILALGVDTAYILKRPVDTNSFKYTFPNLKTLRFERVSNFNNLQLLSLPADVDTLELTGCDLSNGLNLKDTKFTTVKIIDCILGNSLILPNYMSNFSLYHDNNLHLADIKEQNPHINWFFLNFDEKRMQLDTDLDENMGIESWSAIESFCEKLSERVDDKSFWSTPNFM